jgi:hypothetical protein
VSCVTLIHPSSFHLHPFFFSATGGIRTHTVRILRPAPPTDWATVANDSAEAAGVEPARPRKRPPGFRDQSPRQEGQSFQCLFKEHDRSRTCKNPGLQPSRRPSASCSNKPWVRKDSNLRRSHGDSRSTVWRNRRSATHPTRLVRESNPFQHLDRVPCDPLHQRDHRSSQGEQGNRTLATTFTVSRAATTPNSPSQTF